MIIRNILISFSLILSGNVFAHAENKMEWFANTSDGVYTFSYGQAESDFLPIMFSCIKKSGILNVSIQNYEIEPAVSLKKSQITYYNSSGRISHDITIIRDEEYALSDYVFEGSFPYSDEVRSILQENESFNFEIENVALGDTIPSIPKTTKFNVYLDKCAKPL